MTRSSNRRAFVKAALGIAGALALLPAVSAREKTSLLLKPLDDRLAVVSGAGANVVAARGADGLLLIDGGLQEHAAALHKLVLKELAARRVHTLLNTHWHPEQTGSNARLGKAGTRIFAHENTKLWLGYANEVPGRTGKWGPLTGPALPGETAYDGGKLSFAGEDVEYGYLLQAHTDGDLYVFFPTSNVLVTGGAVSGEGWPIIDYRTGGWIGGLVDGLRKLIARADDKTRIVPANGPVLTRADLETQLKMYATIFDRLGKLMRKGLGPDEAIETGPAKEFDAQWGDSRQFLTLAYRSMWGHFAPDA
jgi:glyoxylase-like metal-dependent hydrolase (beta-lactamase superfamily II)